MALSMNSSGSNMTPSSVDEQDYLDYYDSSIHNYPLALQAQPFIQVVTKISVYAIIILTALVGNLLVILVVVKNKRMRTTTNYFIVNLAVSDLMVIVWCCWVYLVDDLSEGWILGSFFCKFNSFAQVTSLIASILSLTLIAVDRFFGIVFAMKAHIIERRACHSLVVIWVISIIVGAPLLYIRQVHERHWKDHVERWCDGEWPSVQYGVSADNKTLYYRPARVAYWTFVSLMLFIIPILAMFGAYCGIMKTLWSARAPGERLKGEIKVQTKMKRKVVIMLVFILTIFTICWVPLIVAILYAEYRPEQLERMGPWYAKFTFFAKTFAFSNSAINPLVYAGFNDNFRQGIGSIFGCYKKQRWTMARIDSFRSTTTTSTRIFHFRVS
ncbi:QRFP-like peptide receptor [Ylistrum balloti]|uniref:QRFP-like peptide receptor n=1 Tax=Ylistrum balloti TaxID=509963 RepID=UPI002905A213|nr:QRFP-like peptide receptor [Ylistrum balloti]